jgi:hypothetical protein
LAQEQAHGFEYASDVQGKFAFYPELLGTLSSCPQLPTTLPLLLDLLRGGGEVTTQNVHEFIYAESQHLLPNGHIYSLDAEIEGIDYLALFEKLLVMWRGYGDGLVPLKSIYQDLDCETLAKHQIGWSKEDNSDRYVARQSVAVS